MEYSFTIAQTEINGEIHLSPRIIVQEPHSMLCDLTYVGGDNGGYIGVIEIIKKIQALKKGDVYCWGSHIIEIESSIQTSKLTDIELVNKWEISTKDLLEFLEKWKIFLETNGFNR